MSEPAPAPDHVTEVHPDAVTVCISRVVDPAREAEMISWLTAGQSLAQLFPGFLGVGWVRPAPGHDTWHALYRFADADALKAWEESPQRHWWRESAAGLVVREVGTEKRSGIEGWFDAPDAEILTDAPPPPPRWKQAITIFMVFYPASLVVNWIASQIGWVQALPLPLRLLSTIVVLTPLMVFYGLPWITRKMDWFLHGRPAPWRRARAS
ncbi:antibiotic biosynthesis monooxygenase [Nocardioides bruguierae]|uniref:antibiotic biosynthesis monooxygenase n=1 Tax=Nocardioides bruguierae TaxID=2945102 RepID=UPI002020BBD4|nr:antibiotic biosynthesis monooxygenase [Nocardioides bruguierae]MCL8023932.1 antibiotic biosynthesis monooxygenase [Nocardioides bruguierae]